jgi:hypothetical protein
VRLTHIQTSLLVSTRGFLVHRQWERAVSPRKPLEQFGTKLIDQMTKLQGANLSSVHITGRAIYLVTGLSQERIHTPNARLHRAKVSEGVGIVPFAFESKVQ